MNRSYGSRPECLLVGLATVAAACILCSYAKADSEEAQKSTAVKPDDALSPALRPATALAGKVDPPVVSEHVWVCNKCGRVITSEKKPVGPGCQYKAGTSASHGWCDVGCTGDRFFTCSPCGASVSVKETTPKTTSCPAGGSHKWK